MFCSAECWHLVLRGQKNEWIIFSTTLPILFDMSGMTFGLVCQLQFPSLKLAFSFCGLLLNLAASNIVSSYVIFRRYKDTSLHFMASYAFFKQTVSLPFLVSLNYVWACIFCLALQYKLFAIGCPQMIKKPGVWKPSVHIYHIAFIFHWFTQSVDHTELCVVFHVCRGVYNMVHF